MHGGPPCSSWVWLNRGTSGRCLEAVMGDPEQPSVVQSNMILDFTPVAMLKHCQKCCKIHPYFLTVLFISLSFNVNIGDLNISY